MELLIADTYNRAVKSYDGSAIVTLLSQGLLLPTSVAVDQDRNVYVCDAELNAVGLCNERGFTPVISQLHAPYSLVISTTGDFFVANTLAQQVQQYRSRRLMRTISGFNNPMDIAVARDGALYIADTKNRVIKKILNEECAEIACGDKNFPWRHLGYPQAVDVSSDGTVYFAETDANRIWAWDGQTFYPALEQKLFRPHAISVFERQMFIADQQGIKFSDGNFVETVIAFPEVCSPQGICIVP